MEMQLLSSVARSAVRRLVSSITRDFGNAQALVMVQDPGLIGNLHFEAATRCFFKFLTLIFLFVMAMVLRMYTVCMQYACSMYAVCMQYVCSMHAVCMMYHYCISHI